MNRLYNSIPITTVARTIANLVGIDAPKDAGPSNEIVCNYAEKHFREKKLDRIFIYNPDAIALWLFQKYTTLFEKAILQSDIQIPMLSIMPSVTPVCFASMYTGAMPEVHGIQTYEKPVLKADTIFDAYIRNGLKPVIVSTVNDSMSHIILERKMDYFICDTSDECNVKAMELIEEDKHDLIVLYNGNYDTTMHRTGPQAQEAINELKKNIKTYDLLVNKISETWKTHRTMIGFCTDHGCHEIDGNLGSHGLDMAEDMNVIHFYKFI